MHVVYLNGIVVVGPPHCLKNVSPANRIGDLFSKNVYCLSRNASATGAHIVGLAAGAEHSLAVSASGQVFSWGCGSNGRLGHAQSSNRLWFWNRDEATPRLVQSFTEKAVSVSCGHMHSGRAQLCCVYRQMHTQKFVLNYQLDTRGYAGSLTFGNLAGCVDSDGRAHAWGYGSYWQLGTGKTVDEGLPQQVSLLCSSLLTAISRGSCMQLAQFDFQAVFQAL